MLFLLDRSICILFIWFWPFFGWGVRCWGGGAPLLLWAVFLTRHVIYSKIIPKSPGLATSKRKTSFAKFLIILINTDMQDEEDCELYIAKCDHHFNVLLASLKVIFIVQYN